MDLSLLDLLRCPFCGTHLDLVDNEALVRDGSRVLWGVLGCQCCAFPVLDGIPVLIADDPTRAAMHAMEAGRKEEALASVLGLDVSAAERLHALLEGVDVLHVGAPRDQRRDIGQRREADDHERDQQQELRARVQLERPHRHPRGRSRWSIAIEKMPRSDDQTSESVVLLTPRSRLR